MNLSYTKSVLFIFQVSYALLYENSKAYEIHWNTVIWCVRGWREQEHLRCHSNRNFLVFNICSHNTLISTENFKDDMEWIVCMCFPVFRFYETTPCENEFIDSLICSKLTDYLSGLNIANAKKTDSTV